MNRPHPAARPLSQPYPTTLIDQVSRVLAQYGRMGATTMYRFKPLTAPLAPGDISQPQSVTFRQDGIAIALMGSEASGDPGIYATTELSMLISGQEDLITDGESGQFADFLTLFAEGYFPLMRYVYTGQSWTVQYQNTQAPMGEDATPSCYIAVAELEASPDIKR